MFPLQVQALCNQAFTQKGLFSKDEPSGGTSVGEVVPLEPVSEPALPAEFCSPKGSIILTNLCNQIDKAIRNANTQLDKIKQTDIEIKDLVAKASPATPVHPTQDLQYLIEQRTVREVRAALQSHRNKCHSVQASSLMGMVTKLLSKKDPEYHSQAGKMALIKEATKLVEGGVWEENAQSKAKVASEFENAIFSCLFPILGIKSYDTSEPVFKGRIVIQGSNMRDGDGEYVSSMKQAVLQHQWPVLEQLLVMVVYTIVVMRPMMVKLL